MLSTVNFGCLAQLVRALSSHDRGRWFEPTNIHQKVPGFGWGLFVVGGGIYCRYMAQQVYYRLEQGKTAPTDEALFAALRALPGAQGVTVEKRRVSDPDPREARTEFYAVVQGTPEVAIEVGFGSAHVDTTVASTPLGDVVDVRAGDAADFAAITVCLGSLGYQRWE